MTRKITLLLYGESGIGKTEIIKTLGYLPEEILYIAADPGQLSLRPTKHDPRDFTGVAYIAPKTGPEFKEALQIIKASASKYKIVVIDGLDQVGNDMLRLFKDNEKGKAKPNMQAAYGDMADTMEQWVGEIHDMPISSLFITHIDEDPLSDIRYTPSFPGRKYADKLCDHFDEVLCMRMATPVPGKPAERVIQTSRDVGVLYRVKDRSGVLEGFEKPDMKLVLDKIFGRK